MPDCEVLVIGGGAAGLNAARILAQAGRQVILPESARRGEAVAGSERKARPENKRAVILESMPRELGYESRVKPRASG